MVLTNFNGAGVGFGMPMNFLGLGAGGGCGVGLGLGWGFGTGFGSKYRSSRVVFQGVDFNKKSETKENGVVHLRPTKAGVPPTHRRRISDRPSPYPPLPSRPPPYLQPTVAVPSASAAAPPTRWMTMMLVLWLKHKNGRSEAGLWLPEFESENRKKHTGRCGGRIGAT
ncbi:hypothetical protein E3N88_45297 [Mikania micrantha]|uniref:Uncharacterized protein n=1 Tax=Mikania micrantha TaxID=192012 RepID=A0A5N6L9Q5_9ASTR|nr:hypothetical protein E3N88_45297 [Mikania micrantha]